MKMLRPTLVGIACALSFAVGASSAIAGHKHGGHYKHGGYSMGYAKPHPMYQRRAHPRCHAKPMFYGHGHGKWKRHGPHWMNKKYGSYGKQGNAYGYGYDASSAKASSDSGSYASSTKVPYGQHSQSATGGHANVSGNYADPAASTPTQQDIVGVAAAAGNFSTLIAAVKAAGLADTLSGEGPFTVLAPNDAAFSALPEGQVAGLMKDTDALKDILTFHVIAGELSAADLLEKGEATTVNGAKISVAQLDVAKADIQASNGVIHVIDSVLIPTE